MADQTSIDLRNQVLRAMQVSNPNLLISYTLPTSSSGLTAAALNILTSALNYGVRVDGNLIFHLYASFNVANNLLIKQWLIS